MHKPKLYGLKGFLLIVVSCMECFHEHFMIACIKADVAMVNVPALLLNIFFSRKNMLFRLITMDDLFICWLAYFTRQLYVVSLMHFMYFVHLLHFSLTVALRPS